jgi:hypothetical protein
MTPSEGRASGPFCFSSYNGPVMSRVIVAEYDANEKALRLDEPLPGEKDHERIRVSIDEPRGNGDRPWLAMRGILSRRPVRLLRR